MSLSSLSIATQVIDEVKSYCSSTSGCAQCNNSATIEQLEPGEGIPQNELDTERRSGFVVHFRTVLAKSNRAITAKSNGVAVSRWHTG
jgi:hypothetical protein